MDLFVMAMQKGRPIVLAQVSPIFVRISYLTSTAKENVSQYGILFSRREDTMQTQEERLIALEQRVDAFQRDSITNYSDNTRLLTILNKVVATQELNYCELSENQTMPAGIISSQ
jgi:hypothetical protein